MSESQTKTDSSELGELFVSVTGDDTVTESQTENPSKEPVEVEAESTPDLDDGLDDAVGADLDSE